jgi:glycosyltransferase involved in cell wall biosynthesis
MKIVFLTHYFPPEVNAPANRTYEHCREWVKAGHEVHVVTCVPSHPVGVPFEGYRSGWYQREERDGMVVHRVWTSLAANRGVIKRTINFLSFVPTAVWRTLRIGPCDLIIGTSPQFFCALAACVSGMLKRTPWIFELRDLWPDSIAAVGARRAYMPMNLLERLELFMYRHARAVVSVSRSFIENLVSRGIDRSKIAFVPNGVDMPLWAAGSRSRGRAAFGLDDRAVVVSYIGTVGMAHDVGTILETAALLRREQRDIRFLIIGDGAELPRLRDQAAAEGLEGVTFTGLVPRELIPDYLAASDVSLVTLKRSEVFKTVLPSKMFESMAAARPIVLAVEGEARETLERARGGLTVPPGDARAMADAICRLADDGALRREMGGAGSRFVAEEFSRGAWAARYLDVLERARRIDGIGERDPQADAPTSALGSI